MHRKFYDLAGTSPVVTEVLRLIAYPMPSRARYTAPQLSSAVPLAPNTVASSSTIYTSISCAEPSSQRQNKLGEAPKSDMQTTSWVPGTKRRSHSFCLVLLILRGARGSHRGKF